MYPKRQTIVRITFWTLGESRGKNTRMNVAPSFELGSAQERVVGARTVLFRLANCQDELLLCCSSRLRTFLRRVTNFRYSNVIVFSNFLFLKTFVWSFVRAWSDITFCYRTSTFLFMNFLRTPVYSFVRTWRTLTFCSRIVISFFELSVFESFRILCARTREVFWKAESLLPPETNSAEKFRGPCHSHGNRAA